MGWIEFAASVVGDVLSWPVVSLVVILLLLKPIRKLISRTKVAKGFGGEVEFHNLLEATEESVDEVLESEPSTINVGEDAEQVPADPSVRKADKTGTGRDPLQPDSTRDPSGAIMTSWQRLILALADLSRTKAGPGRPTRNPKLILEQLRRSEAVNNAFYESAVNLFELRNQVAHGEAIPTQGAALTYVERAHQLEMAARGKMAIAKTDLDKKMY